MPRSPTRRTRKPSDVANITVQGLPEDHSSFTFQGRKRTVESMNRRIAELIMDDSNKYTADIDWGLDLTTDRDGVTTLLKRNGTVTILITINGGARGTGYPRPGSAISNPGDRPNGAQFEAG